MFLGQPLDPLCDRCPQAVGLQNAAQDSDLIIDRPIRGARRQSCVTVVDNISDANIADKSLIERSLHIDKPLIVSELTLTREVVLLRPPRVSGDREQHRLFALWDPFHPVRDYLAKLEWDRTPRIDAWLPMYFGSDRTTYTKAIGAKWLTSAIARIYEPGCQVDHTLLLEGEQGLGKSSGLRAMAGDQWFSDHLSDLASKDSRLELRSKWIIEISELHRI